MHRDRYALGCRCDNCRRRNRERVAAWRRKKAGTDPPEHGLVSSYTNYGCRCRACLDAKLRDLQWQAMTAQIDGRIGDVSNS